MILGCALLALVLAGFLGWLCGRAALRRWAAGAWWLGLLGAVLLVIAGGLALSGDQVRVTTPLLVDTSSAVLALDPLSGLFLVIVGGLAVPVLLAGAAFARTGPTLGGIAGLVLMAVAVIISATDLFAFLFGWELLTLGFYLATSAERPRPAIATGAVLTAAFGKASGAALLVGGLMLAAVAGGLDFSDLSATGSGTARDIAYGLLIVGFGIKAGLIPMHIWLPRGYAAAPGPIRALLAGVAVNVAFYGMWRTLELLGPPPGWLVVAVLVVAGASAVVGIAHAAVHADLRYLIAWSSVENSGVISAGYGAALAGAWSGHRELVAAGLVAATAQVVAHGLGKSALFCSAAPVEQAGGTDLDRLRGVATRLPWAGTAMTVGALTLAGLPLTAGFAGEWFTLEALMQQFRVGSLPIQLAMATAAALVALSIGVAGFTFVRLVGLTVFGRALPLAEGTGDRAWPFRLGALMLTVGCLATAALAPLEIRLIAAGLRPIVGDTASSALLGNWILQPVYAGFSALSPSWLWIVIPGMAAIVTLILLALSGSRSWKVRVVPAWSSASPGVDRGTGYTSYGYANPMRRVLANLLRTKGGWSGDDRYPRTYSVDVVEVVERHIYRPLSRGVQGAARGVSRLQNGRLDAYLGYMFLAVIAVLVVIVALA